MYITYHLQKIHITNGVKTAIKLIWHQRVFFIVLYTCNTCKHVSKSEATNDEIGPVADQWNCTIFDIRTFKEKFKLCLYMYTKRSLLIINLHEPLVFTFVLFYEKPIIVNKYGLMDYLKQF